MRIWPQCKEAFGKLMVLASLVNTVSHKFYITMGSHFTRPPAGESDEEIVAELLKRYAGVLDGRVYADPVPNPTFAVPEEPTERRIAQVAAFVKVLGKSEAASAFLFLCKLKGHEIDFDFGEFPSAPYSQGVYRAFDSGLQLGVLDYRSVWSVKDGSVLKLVPKALLVDMRRIRKQTVPVVTLAADMLYQLNERRWGGHVFYGIASRNPTLLGYWERARLYALSFFRQGRIDRSFLPPGTATGMIIPNLKWNPKTAPEKRHICLDNWKARRIAQMLVNARMRSDISGNGLRALWPYR